MPAILDGGFDGCLRSKIPESGSLLTFLKTTHSFGAICAMMDRVEILSDFTTASLYLLEIVLRALGGAAARNILQLLVQQLSNLRALG